MKKAIEYLSFFQEKLPKWIHIYFPDTEGPFDIAHSVYGDNIFYDIYDDPPLLITFWTLYWIVY